MQLRAFALVAITTLATACGVGRPTLEFGPAQLPLGHTGQPYAATITVSENETPVGDVSISNGTVPPGFTLTFDPDSGSSSAILRGTPPEPGEWTFTVSAWCLGTNVSGQTGEHDFTLSVNN